eukprot:6176912-Amphidinium_carterae.1
MPALKIELRVNPLVSAMPIHHAMVSEWRPENRPGSSKAQLGLVHVWSRISQPGIWCEDTTCVTQGKLDDASCNPQELGIESKSAAGWFRSAAALDAKVVAARCSRLAAPKEATWFLEQIKTAEVDAAIQSGALSIQESLHVPYWECTGKED